VQVSSYHFTNVPGQWETLVTICFAMHHDLAGSPIDIVERKVGDFGRPQAEADQHGQDREVAAAIPRAAVAGCQKAPDLVGIQSLGQPGQSPTSDRWHCGGQRARPGAGDGRVVTPAERGGRVAGRLQGRDEATRYRARLWAFDCVRPIRKAGNLRCEVIAARIFYSPSSRILRRSKATALADTAQGKYRWI
jgi:hypothetical protein